MSEPIPAEIRIGGQIPASLAEELLSAIDEDSGATDWDGGCVPRNTDEMLRALVEDTEGRRQLRLCYADANYGEIPSLEGFLQEHQIPYNRHSDAKYEYDGELVLYRPGMSSPRVFHASQDGQILVWASDLMPLVSLLDGDFAAASAALLAQNMSEAASLLRSLLGLNVAALPAFELVRVGVAGTVHGSKEKAIARPVAMPDAKDSSEVASSGSDPRQSSCGGLAGTRVTTIQIDVNAPADVGDDDVLDLVNKLLEVGYAEAVDTAEDCDLDLQARAEAEMVVKLDIGHPKLMIQPGGDVQ